MNPPRGNAAEPDVAGYATERLVCHVGGFDPMPAATFHARFRRESPRSDACWSMTTTVGPLEKLGPHAAWTITTRGADWQCQTRHLLFGWDDIITAQLQRGPRERLGAGLVVGASFVRHGGLTGYVRVAWRYALFFLYPYLQLLGAAALATLAAMLGAHLGAPGWLAGMGGIGLFWGLYRLAGRRLQLDHLLDDWIFARTILTGLPAPLPERIREMAALIRREAEGREVLIVGHSLGAVIAADLIAALLEQDGPPLRFATIGSSLLKIGLHRRAETLRATLARIAADPRLIWADIQALNDPMNFYKSQPLAALGLPGREAITRQVRFSRMLEPEAYARIRRNLFRLHCQFISGNTRRAPYDYLLMLSGPFPLEAWAGRKAGPMDLIGPEGGLTDEGRTILHQSGAARA